MQNINNQIANELTDSIKAKYPSINTQDVSLDFSQILNKYEIKEINTKNVQYDIKEKISLFLSGKQLEGLSDVTIKNYTLHLNIFSRYVDKKVENITTADIRVYLSKYKKQKTSTLSTKLSVLKSFFGWLTSEEVIPKNPTARIKSPKKEKRFPKALSIEELEMIREVCESNRERALVEFLYSTGCRLSEVQKLNREDINFESKSVMVIGKGNKEREVFFSCKALHHLKKYLFNRLDNEPALFVTERKSFRRLSIRGIQRAIKKISLRTDIKKSVSCHVYRHTLATMLLNNGAELSVVQAILGHENPNTTSVYTQLSDARKKNQYFRYIVQ